MKVCFFPLKPKFFRNFDATTAAPQTATAMPFGPQRWSDFGSDLESPMSHALGSLKSCTITKPSCAKCAVCDDSRQARLHYKVMITGNRKGSVS